MEIVNEAIKCNICKNVLKSPVILQCGESICKAHVIGITEIFCHECEEDHTIPNGQLLVANKKLEKIIQTNIDKCNFGPEYKRATSGCKKLEKMLEDIDLMKNDPCYFIGEIIGQFKNDVDLKREMLKSQIDDEAEALIEKMNEYEKKCRKNLKEKEFLMKEKKLETYKKRVRDKLKILSNDLKTLESNENKWKCVIEELTIIINDLKLKSNVLMQDLTMNRKFDIYNDKLNEFLKIEFIPIPFENLKSQIVDSWRLRNDLFKLCEFTNTQKWSLLYRASEHGFKTSDFHAKCDNKRETLTIIESSNGNIFGGYTDVCWSSTPSYKFDSNAFLFSLINLHKKPEKIRINKNYEFAIYCDSDFGPAFGAGELVATKLNKNNMKEGFSNLHFSYLNSYPCESNFLAGSTEFEITNIEVFIKI